MANLAAQSLSIAFLLTLRNAHIQELRWAFRAEFLRKLELLKLEQLPSLQTDIITEKSISMDIVVTSVRNKGREIKFYPM